MSVYLSPPLLSRKDPVTGRPRKYKFGPWIFPVFKVLKSLKWLRGTPIDPFGRSEERKLDRDLIKLYESDLEEVSKRMNTDNADAAGALLSWPEKVAGFGPVRRQSIEKALLVRTACLDRFQTPPDQCGKAA